MFHRTAIHRNNVRALFVVASSALLVDCSSDSGSGNSATGGATTMSASGGIPAIGGSKSVGGATVGGTSSGVTTHPGGGAFATGGASSQGGAKAGGGATGAGGTVAGVGGIMGIGGKSATGGTAPIDGGPSDDGGYPEDGGEMGTFTMIYNDIINVRCLTCHVPGGAGVASGKLDMSTKALAYANLVGPSMMGIAAAGTQCGTSGLLRVTPGEHATSLLWQKVDAKLKGTTAPCGNAMPIGSATLTQVQVDDIADWIDSGALDD